jgi:hypothetical protein
MTFRLSPTAFGIAAVALAYLAAANLGVRIAFIPEQMTLAWPS